jgi:hypothetical protein
VRLLGVGHEAVDWQVRVQLLAFFEEDIQRIQLVDLHQELRRVF